MWIQKAGITLILLILLGLGVWQYNSSQHQTIVALAQDPQVNDFYFIDYYQFDTTSHPMYRHTVLNVTALDEQNITVRRGNISQSQKGSPRSQLKADRAVLDGFFSNKTLTLSRAQLAELVEKRIIYNVRRPENLSIDGWLVSLPAQPKVYVHQVNPDNQLGIAYYRGEDGLYKDYQSAFDAFRKAAEAGDAAGQTNLAEMYRDGLGTKVDHQQALYWFKQAAGQDYYGAKQKYDALRELAGKI